MRGLSCYCYPSPSRQPVSKTVPWLEVESMGVSPIRGPEAGWLLTYLPWHPATQDQPQACLTRVSQACGWKDRKANYTRNWKQVSVGIEPAASLVQSSGK